MLLNWYKSMDWAGSLCHQFPCQCLHHHNHNNHYILVFSPSNHHLISLQHHPFPQISYLNCRIVSYYHYAIIITNIPMNGTELKSLTWFSPLLNIIALLQGLLLWWNLNNWESFPGVQDMEKIPPGKADLLFLWLLLPENISCLSLDREGFDWDLTFFHDSGIENLGNPLLPILKDVKCLQKLSMWISHLTHLAKSILSQGGYSKSGFPLLLPISG